MDDRIIEKYFDMVIALVRTIMDSDLSQKFEKNLGDVRAKFRQLDGDTVLKDLNVTDPDDPVPPEQ